MAGAGRFVQPGLFSALVVAWGLNYLFVREGLVYSAPVWLAFLRAGVGALGAGLILLLLPRVERLNGRGRRDALLLGLPNTALFFGLWFVGAGSVLPGIASVVVYTFPLWVAMLSGPVLRYRLDARDWMAIAAGFFGVFLIAHPWEGAGGAVPIPALVELLLGAVGWAAGTVLAQRRFRPSEMVEANAYQLVGGASALFVAALLGEGGAVPSPSLPLLGIVLWLGLVGTAFGYAVWFWLLGRNPAARLSAYVFLVPVVALGASALVYQERLDLLQGIGVLLVLAALYVVGIHGGARRRTRPTGSTGLDARL